MAFTYTGVIRSGFTALPAAAALEMATLGGARALGLEEEIGTLEAGKSADVVAVDLGAIETQPVHAPLSHVVYAAGRSQVRDVWIAGRRVLENRALVTLDGEAIAANAEQWRQRMAVGAHARSS